MEFISTNQHILEKIFISSKNSTLLQCRLVCRLWAKEVTRILRKRGVTISFRASQDIEDFLHVARPITQMYTSFLVDIPSPPSPPSPQVTQLPSQVVDLLERYKDDLLELKLWYQPQIQALEENSDLENISNNTEDDSTVVTFKKLHTLHLLSNYVHPSKLPLNGQQQQQLHQMPKYFSHLSTPKLRSLSIQHLYDTECTSIVTKLIETCGNSLESFKIPAKQFPTVALGTHSLVNLTELDLFGIFHGFSCSTNDTIDSIIKSCPRLKKLGIEFSFRATLDKIQEMLATLADTLVELKCTIQDRNLLARQIVRVDFTFPKMAKLKVLQMRWSNPGMVYYIDMIPFLEELMLETAWTRKIQGSIFPGGVKFEDGMSQYTKLTSLKLTEAVNVEQMESFAKYFPNLKILGCSFGSNAALRVVYEKMNRLKWLTIERKSNVTEAEGICGMGTDVDLTINETDFQGMEIQALHDDLYIGNLKELETLELCQLGISWRTLLFAVIDLPKLKTLVLQSKAFRNSSASEGTSNLYYPIVDAVAFRLKQLRHLTLWIRHTSEKPSHEEITFLQQKMYYLDEIIVVNHSLCGI